VPLAKLSEEEKRVIDEILEKTLKKSEVTHIASGDKPDNSTVSFLHQALEFKFLLCW
jgi:hypothetical protein